MASAAEVVPYARRDDVSQFALPVADRHGLDADWVRTTLGAARYQPSVARLVMPPPAGTAKNWIAYRSRFVEPRRIAAGVEFWRANARWLERAEQVYGVPAEIVVGIVGVETIYGQQMADSRRRCAGDAGLRLPAGRRDRSAFFRDELEKFFVLCRGPAVRADTAVASEPASAASARRRRLTLRRRGCDPPALRSSYAGALGMLQFMPSSVNRYAVDFDGDGRIDLRQSAADTIGSVANYLAAAFGWQRVAWRRTTRSRRQSMRRAGRHARARHRAELHAG